MRRGRERGIEGEGERGLHERASHSLAKKWKEKTKRAE